MKLAKDVRLVTRIHPAWQIQGGPVKIETKPISVCMGCQREIVKGVAVGLVLPLVRGQSHSCCFACLPTVGKRCWNLSRKGIAQLIASEKRRYAELEAKAN